MASYDGIQNKIAAKYQRKLGKANVSRADLAFVDHEIVDAHTARVLIAYSPLRGEPTSDVIEKFVWATFEQAVIPRMDTARIFDKNHCVEVLVEKMSETIPFDETKKRKMASVIPNKTYSDKGTIWEVRATEDGTKYLVKRTEDNLDEILAERRKFANAVQRTARFSQLKSGSYSTVQVGDTVEFYSGTKLLQGKVSTMGKDNSVEVTSGGTTFKIQRQAISRVVQHSEAYLRERARMQKEFYQKFLGPELAEKLTSLGPDIEGP
jgi:preprotein translocase subunit YajC